MYVLFPFLVVAIAFFIFFLVVCFLFSLAFKHWKKSFFLFIGLIRLKIVFQHVLQKFLKIKINPKKVLRL